MTADAMTQLIRYSVADAEIATLRQRFDDLSCETPPQYEQTRLAIAELRDIRVAIEARRVELKADALAFGRAVDAEAKRLTGQILDIESPLKASKAVIDDEKERKRQAAVEAARTELEARVRAERDAEEARLRAIREAEALALAEERQRLDAERAALAAERAEQDFRDAERRQKEAQARAVEEAAVRAEREALDVERRAVQQEKERAEREEFERQAAIRAEREAVERIERERVERIRREQELQALLPDVEKAKAFAAAIHALKPPQKIKSKKVAAFVGEACLALTAIATALETKAGRL